MRVGVDAVYRRSTVDIADQLGSRSAVQIFSDVLIFDEIRINPEMNLDGTGTYVQLDIAVRRGVEDNDLFWRPLGRSQEFRWLRVSIEAI